MLKPFYSFCQKYDLGFYAGRSSYLGDLNTLPSISPNYNAGGIFGKVNFNPYVGLRGGFFWGTVGGADSLSKNQWQKDRNLSFQSAISEVNLMLEFNFLKFIPGNKYHNYTPYFFLGLANFRFNPTTTYNGGVYALQPMGTEGQGLPGGIERYKLRSFSIPIGGGFKWNIAGQSSIGVEISARTSFTDYLDDVSGNYYNNDRIREFKGDIAADLADRRKEKNVPLMQPGKQRGNKTYTDFYLYAAFTYTYTFKQSNCPRFK